MRVRLNWQLVKKCSSRRVLVQFGRADLTLRRQEPFGAPRSSFLVSSHPIHPLESSHESGTESRQTLVLSRLAVHLLAQVCTSVKVLQKGVKVPDYESEAGNQNAAHFARSAEANWTFTPLASSLIEERDVMRGARCGACENLF